MTSAAGSGRARLYPAIVDFLDMAKLAPGLRLEEIEVHRSLWRAGAWERPAPATPDAQIPALGDPGARTPHAMPDHDTILIRQ
jgi:hypothetical protein